jgi:hypothetical protein
MQQLGRMRVGGIASVLGMLFLIAACLMPPNEVRADGRKDAEEF